MTTDYALKRVFTRHPFVAVAAYAVVVIALLATVWIALADLYQVRAALADSRDILGKLEARQQSADAANTPGGSVPTGSPFIGGETITVAGAALLQRVAGAITRFGGTVQSSQVDVQGPRSKDGFITLIISGEMEQAGLQKLLYDLEAGMPYMFLDQLVVQAPQTSLVAGGARMQMLIAVSGQWKSAK